VEKEELHRKVFDWYTKQINKGIPVNGPMIQREARLHNPKFFACNQWLRRFKRQYNICTTYNSEDDTDDASREHLTSNQLGSPRAHSATQLSDSQPTVILPQFATTLMSPYLNKTKILTNRDIAKGGLVPSQPNICRFNEILFEPSKMEVSISDLNFIFTFFIFLYFFNFFLRFLLDLSFAFFKFFLS
jgi:hypothetical protein